MEIYNVTLINNDPTRSDPNPLTASFLSKKEGG